MRNAILADNRELRERLLTINPDAEITAIFGFMLTGLVVQDVIKEEI